MSEDELSLLLTTARLLRATIRDLNPGQTLDINDLNDALRPWESNVVDLHPEGAEERNG